MNYYRWYSQLGLQITMKFTDVSAVTMDAHCERLITTTPYVNKSGKIEAKMRISDLTQNKSKDNIENKNWQE